MIKAEIRPADMTTAFRQVKVAGFGCDPDEEK